MKFIFFLLLGTISLSTWAQRKGPIFQMEEIPSQRSLLKAYFAYNAKVAPAHDARLIKYDALYNRLTEADFEVFKSHEFRHTPNLDFSLAFENHHMGFEIPEKKNDQYGFCYGVTTVLRKMNLLAFYDPQNIFGASVPSRDDKDAWLAFYKVLIDQVMRNRPVIIPGFSGLHEFSGDPEIKPYLVRHVLNQWAMNNASLYSGFEQMLLGVKRSYSKKEADELYGKVKARISHHYPPRLFLSKKNYDKPLFGAQYIHVMEAFEISDKKEDGSYSIGVWHINNQWDKATYYIQVHGDGTAWMEWRDLGELDIVPGDDAEIGEIVKNLKAFCETHGQLCS